MLVAIRWTDEAEAIRMANNSHYGLAAYVWTHDIGRALRAAHSIEAGWVQVNQGLGQTPGHSYGGIKQSGIGREFSLEGMLDSFTQKKERDGEPQHTVALAADGARLPPSSYRESQGRKARTSWREWDSSASATWAASWRAI